MNAKIFDGENGSVFGDTVLCDRFARSLEPIDESQHENDLAAERAHGLNGLERRAALCEHIVHDRDPHSLLQSPFDQLLSSVSLDFFPNPEPLDGRAVIVVADDGRCREGDGSDLKPADGIDESLAHSTS